MDHEPIRSALGWRIAIAVIGAALLAGVAVNAAKMMSGQWTWDGRGIAVAAALGLLAVLAVAGVALAVDEETRSRIEDPRLIQRPRG